MRNEWDESVNWIVELRALTAKHTTRVERDRSDDWQEALRASGLFSPFEHQTFANPVRVSVETLRARIASLSFVALLDDEPRARAAGRGLAPGLRPWPGRRRRPVGHPASHHVVWCRRLEV